MSDILSTWGPSFCLLRADSDDGRIWIDRNLSDDDLWIGDAVCVEHRYVADIILAAVDDGLTVEDTASGRIAARPE